MGTPKEYGERMNDFRQHVEDVIKEIRWHLSYGPAQEAITVQHSSALPGHYIVSLVGRLRCSPLTDTAQEEINRDRNQIDALIPDPDRLGEGSFLPLQEQLDRIAARLEIRNMKTAASSEPDDFHEARDSVLDILEARLEVGYFIVGFRELWPRRAEWVVHKLKKSAGLDKLDESLLSHLGVLARYSVELRNLLATDATRLPEDEFGSLLVIARR